MNFITKTKFCSLINDIVAENLKVKKVIDPSKKWQALKNKSCIIEPIYYGKQGSYYKYYDKRQRQLYKKARELILNNNFIAEVIRFANKFKLNNIVYSLSPEILMIDLYHDFAYPYEGLNNNFPRREPLKLNENTIYPLERYYNSEHKNFLTSFWRSELQLMDASYIKKHIAQINKESKSVNPNKPYIENIPLNLYRKRLEKIINAFNLSIIWEDSIELLLITGYFFIPYNIHPIIIESDNDKITISIPIGHDTQREDLIYSWEKINKIKEQIYGKNKRIKSSAKADWYLDLATKINAGADFSDLVDFDEMGIPYEKTAEIKAINKLKKGINRAKKSVKSLKPSQIKNPELIDIYKKIIGSKETTFLF